MTYRPLIVGGTFADGGGKASKIIDTIAAETGWPALNGGTLSALEALDFRQFDVLVWMPNIDNDEEKILPQIKKANPHLLLVSSKRAVEKTYTEFDLISRLLKSRSNLGIMIERKDGRYSFRIIDPLGNMHCETQDVPELARALRRRVDTLTSLKRINSQPFGTLEPAPQPPEEFVDLVRQFGDCFSRCINAANPERFLGNASARPEERTVRCCHGFPAFREAGCYLVSRRDVDKATMSASDFVAVLPEEAKVLYAGERKPSVDAPIQIRLFNTYPNVNFIIHGHVYLDNAPLTKSKIPCGFIEEYDEIRELFPARDSTNFGVNLRGHGCLILARDLDYMRKQKAHLTGRVFPEP